MSESLTRFLSGIVYVTLLLGATSYSMDSFFILFGLFMLIAIYEFCGLVHINRIAPLIIGTVAFYWASQFRTNKTNDILLLIVTLFISIKCLLLLFNFKKEHIGVWSRYLFTLGYVILPFLILVKIPFSNNEYRPKIIISIFLLIWTNDTFAYIVGKSIGKHKLLEKISPKKTIEGFFGGMAFTILMGYFISRFYFQPKPEYTDTSVLIWTVSAGIVSVFSTLGDLIESKFKRIAGVKDSGKIMPGHGGILDRLDSIIFVTPFVFLFYQILDYVS
jgi:phosphatidate cytidylyltransferase